MDFEQFKRTIVFGLCLATGLASGADDPNATETISMIETIETIEAGATHGASEPDATDIVRRAVDHWRGLSSYSDMTMVIHRPDWERSMTMRAWTKGDDRSLVRVTEPAKDRGNATLTDDDNMWTFSPKVNRVIKIPSSMMGQAWMGSDFSNKDITRADDIVDQYAHAARERHGGRRHGL